MAKTLALAILIVITVLFFPDLIHRWSWQFWWYDVVLHFLGGVFVGLLYFIYLAPASDLRNHYNWVWFLGWLFFVGLLWEGFEVLLDLYLLEKKLPAFYLWDGLLDTAADLFFDLTGGVVLWLVYAIRGHGRQKTGG